MNFISLRLLDKMQLVEVLFMVNLGVKCLIFVSSLMFTLNLTKSLRFSIN